MKLDPPVMRMLSSQVSYTSWRLERLTGTSCRPEILIVRPPCFLASKYFTRAFSTEKIRDRNFSEPTFQSFSSSAAFESSPSKPKLKLKVHFFCRKTKKFEVFWWKKKTKSSSTFSLSSTHFNSQKQIPSTEVSFKMFATKCSKRLIDNFC